MLIADNDQAIKASNSVTYTVEVVIIRTRRSFQRQCLGAMPQNENHRQREAVTGEPLPSRQKQFKTKVRLSQTLFLSLPLNGNCNMLSNCTCVQ